MTAPALLSRLWHRVRASVQPQPIATRAALQEFLEQRSLFVAQKCAIDYCRGKTGLASYALFTERPFLEALDVCRWEAFEAVLGDLIILVEGWLRPHAGPQMRPRLCQSLVQLHSDILARAQLPAHRPQGWGDALASFAERFGAASRNAPRATVEVAEYSARRLFDTLPIHASMRALDEEVVYGAVRFRMIALREELQRRASVAELIDELTT
jgi:ribosomal protein S18 acetylase RimI-like enzyme